VSPACEASAIQTLGQTLRVEADELAAAIALERRVWLDSGTPSKLLRSGIIAALSVDTSIAELSDRSRYFSLLDTFVRRFDLPMTEARRLLSHYRTIVYMRIQGATASQISRVLSAVDPGLMVTWQPIQQLLGKRAPVIDLSDIDQVVETDLQMEPIVFADADIDDSINLVAEEAGSLGVETDIAPFLRRLLTGEPPYAYLAMLHYQCIIAEFFDHPPSWLYEFKPRGRNANRLVSRIYSGHLTTGNPILNNAKAQARADRNWASTRASRLWPQAYALVAVLEQLDGMGPIGRRQLCGLMRQLLIRSLGLRRPITTQPLEPPKTEVEALAQRLGAHPTQTEGILEQRYVEVVTQMLHRNDRGWAGRGLGDSVNASNLSRKKLGDCEFLNADNCRLVAYEPTAGRLLPVYLAAHQQSLQKVIELRHADLAEIADPDKWELEVVFVAHKFNCALPASQNIRGFRITYRFSTFTALLMEVTGEQLESGFSRGIIDAITMPRTPDHVRAKWNSFVSA
jgi:hypothetical protein